MKSSLVTLVAGLSLAIPAWAGVASPSPTTLHPFPCLTTIGGLVSAGRGWGLVGAFLMWPALFFVWHPQLFRGTPAVPRRTYLLWLTATLLSIVWFVNYLIDWHDLSRHWHDIEDLQKWRLVNGVSGALAVVIGLMLLWARLLRTPSFAFSVLVHWITFAWLAWRAFPASPTL
jgi:hypothetical protein